MTFRLLHYSKGQQVLVMKGLDEGAYAGLRAWGSKGAYGGSTHTPVASFSVFDGPNPASKDREL